MQEDVGLRPIGTVVQAKECCAVGGKQGSVGCRNDSDFTRPQRRRCVGLGAAGVGQRLREELMNELKLAWAEDTLMYTSKRYV